MKIRKWDVKAKMEVYMAKFYRDKPLKNNKVLPTWLVPIQAGAALTGERVAEVLDNSGYNISHKNGNYCELTVLYWIWKNRITSVNPKVSKYYGLFHYRRWLDIDDEDIGRLYKHEVDIVLPYPTIHEPNIMEHHERYIQESDWNAVIRALEDLAPEYYRAYDKIFSQQYLYNYNIIIAKADIMRSYCEWLFPILERVEEFSIPKGSEREDRYIGYIGENLLTLYFMHHGRDFHIVHTGRIMLS